MTISNEDVQAIIDATAGVSKGPWFTDGMKSDGYYGSGEDVHEGFETYAVYSENEDHYGKPAAIFDAFNADVATIEEEFGEESHHAWDEQSRKNMAYLARLSPEVVGSLLRELLTLRQATETLRGWVQHWTDDKVAGLAPTAQSLAAAIALADAALGKAGVR